jgi:hypothetical protein
VRTEICVTALPTTPVTLRKNPFFSSMESISALASDDERYEFNGDCLGYKLYAAVFKCIINIANAIVD